MATLKHKVKNALDENRILILGSQALIGFQYQAFFHPAFERLPNFAQKVALIGLMLLLFTLALLLSSTSYHQIVEKGEDTVPLHQFILRMMGIALLPFALGIGVELYLATATLTSGQWAFIAGAGISLVALSSWYGIEAVARQKLKKKEHSSVVNDEPKETKLKDKIVHALTEARIVLPGAQALLGFQFASMFMDGFQRLPESSKAIHLGCLFLLAICTIFLMTPAAYHRLVERGEDSEGFYRLASRFTLAAMVPLALGVCGDLFVVVRKTTQNDRLSIWLAMLMLVFFFGFWFGFTFYRRYRQPRGV